MEQWRGRAGHRMQMNFNLGRRARLLRFLKVASMPLGRRARFLRFLKVAPMRSNQSFTAHFTSLAATPLTFSCAVAKRLKLLRRDHVSVGKHAARDGRHADVIVCALHGTLRHFQVAVGFCKGRRKSAGVAGRLSRVTGPLSMMEGLPLSQALAWRTSWLVPCTTLDVESRGPTGARSTDRRVVTFWVGRIDGRSEGRFQ